jgi:pyruvate-formate lyase-activating enzyme
MLSLSDIILFKLFSKIIDKIINSFHALIPNVGAATFRKIGLKKIYSRETLDHVFKILIDKATANDEVLIVGRTLRWVGNKSEEILNGLAKGVDFKLLCLEPNEVFLVNTKMLDADIKIIRKDLDSAFGYFEEICKKAVKENHRGSFIIKTCDFIIPNSLTSFKGSRECTIIYDFSFGVDKADKYALRFERRQGDDNKFCKRLYEFYKNIFDNGKTRIRYLPGGVNVDCLSSISIGEIQKDVIDIINSHLNGFPHVGDSVKGDSFRNNLITNYLSDMPDRFATIIKEDYRVPPPICVQLEVANNSCNCKCKMCKRYMWPEGNQLKLEEIQKLIDSLVTFGVKTLVISGGEPFSRGMELVQSLKYGREAGLRMGLLTNGLGVESGHVPLILENLDWIRISLDGVGKTYEKIREIPFEKVKNFFDFLIQRPPESTRDCEIGICYSIQKENASIKAIKEMLEFCEYLNKSYKEKHNAGKDLIKRLDFKFAHGSKNIDRDVSKFLCSHSQISKLKEEIDKNPDWINKPLMSVDYVRNIYLRPALNYTSIEEICDGEPFRSFYAKKNIICFTPYIFSLIDAQGDVYPCCYTHYNNYDFHIHETKSKKYKMGNIRDYSFDFRNLWRSPEYQAFRKEFHPVRLGEHKPCGECTRHFLHNDILTKLFTYYKTLWEPWNVEKADFKKAISESRNLDNSMLFPQDSIVWF